MKRIFAVVLALAGLFIAPSFAAAQSYPNHPITFVVPYPPGGVADVVGRQLAERIGAQLKQTIIVENRAGAAGTIGSAYVAKAKPDGYTILVANNATLGIVPLLRKDKPYDPVKDFTPIATAIEAYQFLGVSNNVPARNLKEFVEWAKKNGSSISYGSPGPGSFGNFAAELMRMALGINALHIPYKGSGPALIDLAGGQLQFMVDPSVIGPPMAGKVRVLATTGPARFPGQPDVPTFRELGYDLSITGWQGLVGPPGLPHDIRDMLAKAVAAAIQDPVFKKSVEAAGSVPAVLGPDALAARIKADLEVYADVKRKVGMQEE